MEVLKFSLELISNHARVHQVLLFCCLQNIQSVQHQRARRAVRALIQPQHGVQTHQRCAEKIQNQRGRGEGKRGASNSYLKIDFLMGCTFNNSWVLPKSANAFLCWHLSLKVERFSSKQIATPQFYKILVAHLPVYVFSG